MTRRHVRTSLAIATGLTSFIALAPSTTAPIAHADPLDGIRGAVNGARAQSTCPPLTYSGQLEAAAQQMARQPPGGYLHIDPHGYQGSTSGNLVRDDPTAKATSELVEQERNGIHDCANKDYGVGMFRDEGADQSIVTLVLGRPAAPPAPPPPAQPPPAKGLATVIGGDADVYNIAHNDVPDPTSGVRGQKIGTLKNGSQVSLAGPCQSGWCRVNSSVIQGGYGFVEQGHLQLN